VLALLSRASHLAKLYLIRRNEKYQSTSCGYVKVDAAILEMDDASATSPALSASMVVLSDKNLFASIHWARF